MQMNDEAQISDGSSEPMRNTEVSEDTVQYGPEMGVTEEPGTDAEHDSEHTTEPVVLEKRTLLDMFRD